ncbi:MAG: hypothetical protein QOJ79_1841 [Actinomycetota bacterium]|jgi:hypothetical protein|nr:hypothetical protein [Actinomycetota bacterium]
MPDRVTTDFDFWVGRWDVTDPSDGSRGHNTIRRILGGKVLEESAVMRLERRDVVNGNAVTQRMEWSEIGPDRLVWQWMRAPVGSEDFQLLWRLHYLRRT